MSYLVLIADDHPLYRDARKIVVAGAFADVECRESRDIASTLEMLACCPVDLVLLDLSMPDATGLDGLRRLREYHPRWSGAWPVARRGWDSRIRTTFWRRSGRGFRWLRCFWGPSH